MKKALYHTGFGFLAVGFINLLTAMILLPRETSQVAVQVLTIAGIVFLFIAFTLFVVGYFKEAKSESTLANRKSWTCQHCGTFNGKGMICTKCGQERRFL